MDDFYVYLTTTDRLAEEINSKRLAGLKDRPYTFTGSIEGDFGQEYLPTAIELQVKSPFQSYSTRTDWGKYPFYLP